jgi:hypothetical protein
MSNTEQAMIEEAAITVAEGVPTYDRYTYAAANALEFQGKTMSTWISELELHPLRENMSVEELETFNQKYLEISEQIMSNLSKARANFGYTNIHYRRKLSETKKQIVESIYRYNEESGNPKKKRIPGKESLEDMAKDENETVWTAYKIAEIWLGFWEDHHEKMKLASFRLTSLNTMKNIESRLG